VDTTGAGDGFVAGMLAGLLDHDLSWDQATIEDALRLGNAVGALTTTARGAPSHRCRRGKWWRGSWRCRIAWSFQFQAKSLSALKSGRWNIPRRSHRGRKRRHWGARPGHGV